MPDQEPSGDQEGETDSAIESSSLSEIENQKAKERTSADTQKKETSDKFLRWGTFTVDALVFIAVVVYGVFACLQWIGMRGQLDAMRQQLSEMKESKLLSRFDQRAWVGIVSASGKAELYKSYTIKITIRNTGKTLAKNFSGVTSYRAKQISDPDPDFDSIIAADSANRGTSVALLTPNRDCDQMLDVPEDGRKLTYTEIETFKNPNLVFLIFGKITYLDIFKCKHWTTFCYRAYPIKGEYDAYTAYNDADDNECP